MNRNFPSAIMFLWIMLNACMATSEKHQAQKLNVADSTTRTKIVLDQKRAAQPGDIRKVCKNSQVPPGFVVINHGTDLSSCNHHPQYNHVNVKWIQRISNLPVGAVVRVCHYQATPPNWADIDYQRDLTCCDERADIIYDNVKYIQRVQ